MTHHMRNDMRNVMLELIQSNIAKYGHHIYLVSGGPLPRSAYTIGVSPKMGAELIFAGASFYLTKDVKQIINKVVEQLRESTSWHQLSIEVDRLGVFSLCKADASWVNTLMLGALDFYSASEIPALQIVPDQAHWTIDIPNLTQSWNMISEPVWQWLYEPWRHSVSEHSVAITNLDALRGKPITEVMRWEEKQWELFAGAGPDVLREDIREVPLGTVLAIDQSLQVITNLGVGQGLWRDSSQLEWHSWKT
jgi:hypothetical protein